MFKYCDANTMSATANAHWAFKAPRPCQNTIEAISYILYLLEFKEKPDRVIHNEWRRKARRDILDAILKATKKREFSYDDAEVGWRNCEALITTKPTREAIIKTTPVPTGVKGALQRTLDILRSTYHYTHNLTIAKTNGSIMNQMFTDECVEEGAIFLLMFFVHDSPLDNEKILYSKNIEGQYLQFATYESNIRLINPFNQHGYGRTDDTHT